MTLSEMQAALKAKQHDLGTAMTAARGFSQELLDNPDRAAELQEKFEKARDDSIEMKRDCQNLEQAMEAERQHKALGQPGNPLRHGDEAPIPKGVSSECHTALFNDYIRTRGDIDPMRRMYQTAEKHGVGAEEVHALLSTADDLGGFTVPEDFRAEVIKATAGFSVMRAAGARVVPTSRNGVTFPTINRGADPYSSDLQTGESASSNWKPEGFTTGGAAPPIQNRPTFGQERVPVHVWQPDAIELTVELIEDSAVPLDSIIAQLIGEVKALDEDREFLIGNGVGRPEGILNSGAQSVVIGDESTYATPVAGDNGLSYQRIVDVFVNLGAQYRQNAAWIMSSDSFGRVLSLTDPEGNLLFAVNSLPGTLMTRPIFMSEFMPTLGAQANVPVFFGDWRNYIIAERRDVTIQRLTERFAPNIGILPTARVGGQAVMTDAMRLTSVQA